MRNIRRKKIIFLRRFVQILKIVWKFLFLSRMMNNDEISVKAVELLFTKQRRTFLNLAMSMVHDAEIAEDILHDSFISLWEKRESVDDFIDYLYITIRNNCLRYRRDTSIHKAVYDKIAQKEQGLMEIYTRTIDNCDVAKLQEKEVSNIIYDVMSKLSVQDRKIFMMKKFDGKSYKEISEELGITTSVIDHSLRNTTAKMKVALADYTAVLLMILSMHSSI